LYGTNPPFSKLPSGRSDYRHRIRHGQEIIARGYRFFAPKPRFLLGYFARLVRRGSRRGGLETTGIAASAGIPVFFAA